MSLPDGVEILGPAEPRFDEILTDEALAFVAGLQREFGGRRAELLEARAERQTRLDEGERPAFLEATRSVRESDVDGRTRAARPAGPPRRDHRPHRPQDGDQRAQQRRAVLHGRPRGFERPDVVEHGRRPGEPRRRRPSHDRAHRPGRARVPARRPSGDAARPSPRLAPARTPPARRRLAGLGEPVRLRARVRPQRARAARARHGALLLPAEARGPPRGAPVERRLRLGAGPARDRRAARSARPS